MVCDRSDYELWHLSRNCNSSHCRSLKIALFPGWSNGTLQTQNSNHSIEANRQKLVRFFSHCSFLVNTTVNVARPPNHFSLRKQEQWLQIKLSPSLPYFAMLSFSSHVFNSTFFPPIYCSICWDWKNLSKLQVTRDNIFNHLMEKKRLPEKTCRKQKIKPIWVQIY